MRNSICKFVSIGVLMVLLASCASPAKILYFQDVDGVEVSDSLVNFEPKIQVGDVLSINVSAVDPEAAIPFNVYETPIVGNTTTNAKPLTYLVDVAGYIHFPVIGKLKVTGLSTKDLNDMLTSTLEDYIKNPIVNIRLTNFKVTVLGQVNKPGSYDVPNERISIVDAIGLAGDLEIHGKRTNVLLIREQNGKRMFITLDVTNKKIFSSPYYYLAQNDVIYVEPNKVQVNASAVGANTGIIISVTSLLITVLSIIFR